MNDPKPVIAIYARYSCDRQRETSIEDQVRRCRELVAQLGFNPQDCLVFVDSAVSGQAYANEKRVGYQRLLVEWKANRVQIIVVDEFERLTRDDVEQAVLRRLLSENKRVRLITVDGTDTLQAGWELRLGIKAVIAQDELRKIRHRVGRGMVGQLERGYMIATPAFGYDLERHFDEMGNRIGTHWKHNEFEGTIVREIFARREAGESMHQLAKWLNETGVRCPRTARSASGGYWRPAGVRRVLANPIYRGEFVWHGSDPFKHRARKRGEKVEERTYPRPQLRIVSDETWFRCNARRTTRSGYGGGRHALGGLITCGCCGGTLVVTSKTRCRSVYCAGCTVARGVNGERERQSITVATVGVQLLLVEALRTFISDEFIARYRHSVHDNLYGDRRREKEACEAELKKARLVQARFAKLLAEVDGDDEALANHYREARRNAQALKARLAEISAGCAQVDNEAVAAQMAVDPARLLPDLFAEDLPPHRVRVTLARLFPSIALEGKDGKYRSIFRIRFSPGAALALASGTETIIIEEVELRFELRYVPAHLHKQPYWTVKMLPGPDGEELSLPQLAA